MAKLLYSIKIHLFRDENVFKTTQTEKSQLERFVIYRVIVYVKYWIEDPMATNALWSDLLLLHDMTKYQDIDLEISEVVKNALKPHLWYLLDELVGLSLFSKKYLVRTRWKLLQSGSADRKVRGDSALLTNQAILIDFVSKRSY